MPKLLSKHPLLLLAILGTIILVALVPLSSLWTSAKGTLPRHLEAGDRWTYKVLYPDSKSYELTENVQSIVRLNGTESYLILRDDDQHISTQYLWITPDWHEIKAFKPQIGNLLATSNITYTPPIELFRIPFHSGDRWSVTSLARTITRIGNTTIESISPLDEVRETKALDEVRTPVGGARAFKVTVTVNGTLLESLWFDANLGQVVYAEYYNGKEETIQTLMSYSLATRTSVTEFVGSVLPCTEPNRAIGRKLYVSKNCHFTLRS